MYRGYTSNVSWIVSWMYHERYHFGGLRLCIYRIRILILTATGLRPDAGVLLLLHTGTRPVRLP